MHEANDKTGFKRNSKKRAQIKTVEWLITTPSYNRLNIHNRNSKW